jgi:peptidoglycan-N-acetylglucosamine deacetylase
MRRLYSECIWQMAADEKKIYLTFDDGPHPIVTTFILDELKKYHAKATFFCIGNNVEKHNDVYNRILMEGHAVGNHTNNHVNGWKVSNETYFNNIHTASLKINSQLFRPPYGRITKFQLNNLVAHKNFKVIMWSILSGDFDINITPEKCWHNVKANAKNGSIIVFHDSEKAAERCCYALPLTLEYFGSKGFSFDKILP